MSRGATLQIRVLLSEICLIRFQVVAGISICLWGHSISGMQLKAVCKDTGKNFYAKRNLVACDDDIVPRVLRASA